MDNPNVWKRPEVIKLVNEIEDLKAVIEKRVKDNRLELYNVGEKIHKLQIAFHQSAKRIKAIFGGNRTGKTVGGAVEAINHALGSGRFRKLKPSSGWVVSLTSDVQKEVAQKEILRWLPKKEIHNIVMRHGRKDDLENSLIETIVLKNGQTIGFKTCEQGRESFQGPSKGWIWFDEEPPEDVFKECWMRVMDVQGDIWFTMTPLLGLTWVYALVFLNEKNNPNIEYWMFQWEDNPWLLREEIAQRELVMNDEEREARQYGRFTSLCGFAFIELKKEIHIKKPEIVPDWYKRYVSIDYGLDSLAALWYWTDNYGNARIYRALRKKNLIISDAAREILKFTGNEKIEAYYAPPDLWNRRQDTGKSAAMIFYEKGISLLRTSNDRENGWLNIHEWLRPYKRRDEQTGEEITTAKLTFDEGLDPDLWKHLTTIQKSEKNPNDVAVQPHEVTHYPDSLRCFCVSRMLSSSEPEADKHYNFESEKPKSGNSYFGSVPNEDYFSGGY
jgi:phage terminase large subunit-like protein